MHILKKELELICCWICYCLSQGIVLARKWWDANGCCLFCQLLMDFCLFLSTPADLKMNQHQQWNRRTTIAAWIYMKPKWNQNTGNDSEMTLKNNIYSNRVPCLFVICCVHQLYSLAVSPLLVRLLGLNSPCTSGLMSVCLCVLPCVHICVCMWDLKWLAR